MASQEGFDMFIIFIFCLIAILLRKCGKASDAPGEDELQNQANINYPRRSHNIDSMIWINEQRRQQARHNQSVIIEPTHSVRLATLVTIPSAPAEQRNISEISDVPPSYEEFSPPTYLESVGNVR